MTLNKLVFTILVTCSSAFAADDSACKVVCRPCSVHEGCSEICEKVGSCQNDRCHALGICVNGYQWSEKACRCLLAAGGTPSFTVQCGTALCTKGEECCNESCSICVPEGGVCTQQLCE